MLGWCVLYRPFGISSKEGVKLPVLAFCNTEGKKDKAYPVTGYEAASKEGSRYSSIVTPRSVIDPTSGKIVDALTGYGYLSNPSGGHQTPIVDQDHPVFTHRVEILRTVGINGHWEVAEVNLAGDDINRSVPLVFDFDAFDDAISKVREFRTEDRTSLEEYVDHFELKALTAEIDSVEEAMCRFIR